MVFKQSVVAAPGLLWLLSGMLALTACGAPSSPSKVSVSTQAASLSAQDQCSLAFTSGLHPVDSSANWLGQAFSKDGQNLLFKVYSASATRVQVELYDASGAHAATVALIKDAPTNIWYAAVPVSSLGLSFGSDLFSGVTYGLRAWGPNWPYSASWTPGSAAGFVSDVDASGNRFDPNKLLTDPYALELNHDQISPAQLDGSVYSTGATNRATDTAAFASRGYIANTQSSAWGQLNTGSQPGRAQKDDVVYEVQLRGFTEADASMPSNLRGTYAGAAKKAGYLKSLGVNSVEFLPLQETEDDANDLTGGNRSASSDTGDNYWGYMTTSYFAPDRRFSSDQTPGGPTREFAAMVKSFHDAGIKVVADVVYNHSGEGGLYSSDPSQLNLWSMRGLDNPTYYLLSKDKQSDYDITGTGNTLNTHNPQVQNLILNSLHYYHGPLGVDGFRFDLGIALGNTSDNTTNPQSDLRFTFNAKDSSTASAKIASAFPGVYLSAEPWGLAGDQSYQLGNFGAGWSEWNGQFRDFFRRAQNKLGSRPITPGQLVSRFAGSSDLFGNRAPFNSINFIDVHDGLTLKDLYSCNGKNNAQAWPAGPSDGGTDDEDSWDNNSSASLQRQQARDAISFLALSQGTPLMQGGDEMLRSLNCNNNAYNLDSSFNWLNWSLSADQQNFLSFVQGMWAFRAAHPALRRAQFFDGTDHNGNGLKDVTWLKSDGTQADSNWFSDSGQHALAFEIDGSEQSDSVMYVAYNGWSDLVNYTLPAPPAGQQWYRVTDTSAWAEGSGQVKLSNPDLLTGSSYGLNGRAVLLLIAK